MNLYDLVWMLPEMPVPVQWVIAAAYLGIVVGELVLWFRRYR